jgi:hypothetical protein
VNHGNISLAVEHFTQRGYVYTEDAPWYVGPAAYFATKPPGAVDIQLRAEGKTFTDVMGHPVASGEQSFLQMMLDGQPLKRAICVTPCWRYESRMDMLHRKYFMKAELINAQDTDEAHLVDMIHDACTFFERFFSVRTVKIGDAYDIVEKGTRIELGSYGIRERDIDGKRFRWIYGTACAEPRLSTVIQRHSKLVGK